MSRPALRRADRHPPHAAVFGRVLAAAFAVAVWLLGAGLSSADAAGKQGPSPLPIAAHAGLSIDADDAAARVADVADLLAVLDPDAAADVIALHYADVVPASPAESPPEAVQRELRDDVQRLATLCRERVPSPLPGASCDLPVPSIDPPQAGPVPAAPVAGPDWGQLRLRVPVAAEPAGVERAPLHRPPRA